jgi:serine/threonine protein kinase
MTSGFSPPEPQGVAGALGPGTRLAGYVIEEQIGAGGMAVVYRARDEMLGRLAAVKVIAPALAADEAFRARFLRESRAVAAVQSPYIIPVFGAGEVAGVLYLATRFVASGDLGMAVRRSGGTLAPDLTATVISQVAAALDAAHATGLVHRDVKPGNILVESLPGQGVQTFLSDFGLSKNSLSTTTGLSATGQFLGTPDYSPPEQIRGGDVDGRADQYALACVAFMLLGGVPPFHRADTMAIMFAHVADPVPSLAKARPELPAAVDAVLDQALAKSPADRYRSCGEFAAALRDALADRGQAAGVSRGTHPRPGDLARPASGGAEPFSLAVPSVPPSMPSETVSMPRRPVPMPSESATAMTIRRHSGGDADGTTPVTNGSGGANGHGSVTELNASNGS